MGLQHSVEEVMLQNGATGLIISVPGVQTVHYDIHFLAGVNHATRPGIGQVAHIMEHMTMGANQQYQTQREFSRVFTRHGAWSNASTGSDEMVYVVDAAKQEWQRILGLLELSITKPLFNQVILDNEKETAREELLGNISNTERQLAQLMTKRAGLRRWHDKDQLKTIDAVTLTDIREHYGRTHVAKNMRFVIAGDFTTDCDELIDALNAWHLPEGEPLTETANTAHSTGLVYFHDPQAESVHCTVGFFVNRTATTADAVIMNVLTHIVTGTFHSRIWGKAQDAGICYDISSTYTSIGAPLEWEFNLDVSAANVPKVLALIATEMLILRDELVGIDELQEAKDNRTGRLLRDGETVGELVEWYKDEYYAQRQIDYLHDYHDKVTHVAAEDIRDLVNEFLSSGVWSFGVSGSISKQDAESWYTTFKATMGVKG